MRPCLVARLTIRRSPRTTFAPCVSTTLPVSVTRSCAMSRTARSPLAVWSPERTLTPGPASMRDTDEPAHAARRRPRRRRRRAAPAPPASSRPAARARCRYRSRASPHRALRAVGLDLDRIAGAGVEAGKRGAEILRGAATPRGGAGSAASAETAMRCHASRYSASPRAAGMLALRRHQHRADVALDDDDLAAVADREAARR